MLVVLASWRGSPGVTTAALALAEAWPGGQDAFVAECDPRGGTLVPRFLMPGPRRLTELAGRARHGGVLSLLAEHAVSTPSNAKVLTGPEDGRQLRAALAALVVADGVFEQAAADSGTVVLADCGRLEPGFPEVASLLNCADALVLTVRPTTEQLLALSGSREQIVELHRRVGLLLIGPGHGSQQVSELLDLPVFGRLPWAAPAGASWRSRLRRRAPLAEAASEVAARLVVEVRSDIPAQRAVEPPVSIEGAIA